MPLRNMTKNTGASANAVGKPSMNRRQNTGRSSGY